MCWRAGPQQLSVLPWLSLASYVVEASMMLCGGIHMAGFGNVHNRRNTHHGSRYPTGREQGAGMADKDAAHLEGLQFSIPVHVPAESTCHSLPY